MADERTLAEQLAARHSKHGPIPVWVLAYVQCPAIFRARDDPTLGAKLRVQCHALRTHFGTDMLGLR